MLKAKRILVYGVCGSGKSTMARRISEITGIPWTSVDDMAWLPNWVPADDDWQVEQITLICAGDEWILDTAYGKWIDIPLEKADLIVALDYPRWFSFWRLLKRTVSRIRTRESICNGNVETWSKACDADSILLWHMKSWKRKRQRIRVWQKDPSKRVIAFTTAREADLWLESLQRDSRLDGPSTA
jgi:adenylate kinase family enzyme